MLTAHRLAGTWDNKVDVYIALTEFGREQFIRGGIPEGKIVVKPHFVDSPPPHQGGRGEYALYVGRLSEEKGIRVLLDAWKQLGKDLPLKIIGDGPMTKEVAEAAHRQGGICLLGRQPREKVLEFMEQAELLVFPSVCNETFGLTIIEAFSVGLPVIASDLGVVTSLVEHQRTGLRFKPGNAEDLAAKVRDAISRPADLEQMRKAARAEYVAKYTPEHNYEMLIEIYQRVLKSK
jgi:glycosyltransferase involved in cell wall biosynthesis